MTYSISIIIPTLNSSAVLKNCLASIARQDYPREKLEIIICDGGSTDETLEMARASGLKIRFMANPLKTGEAGKAQGIAAASGEIMALVDSDNELPEAAWLQKMTAPFDDPEIFASESLGYAYLKNDSLISRYAALTGNPDPLCNFIGNYSYYSHLSGRWTLLPVLTEDQGGYFKVEILDDKKVPTFGANGFLIRAAVLKKLTLGDYYFDIDAIQTLVRMGYRKLAKVKTTVVHHFCRNYFSFVKKQLRRIRDYQHYRAGGQRQYEWRRYGRGYFKFLIYTILIFPLIIQVLIGFSRKKDSSWLFHPVGCWTTLLIYGYGFISGFFKRGALDRRSWKN